MSNLQDGPTTGQVGTSTPSVNPTPTTAPNDVSELLRVMETSSKAIARMTAVLTSFGARLDALEGKSDVATDDDDEPAPITEKRPLDPSPRLALRSDGAVLIELTSDIDDADVAAREVRRYATLNEAERADAVDRADEVLTDVAARSGWQLARGRLGYPVKPTTETP